MALIIEMDGLPHTAAALAPAAGHPALRLTAQELVRDPLSGRWLFAGADGAEQALVRFTFASGEVRGSWHVYVTYDFDFEDWDLEAAKCALHMPTPFHAASLALVAERDPFDEFSLTPQ